jgi:hypothetical protein
LAPQIFLHPAPEGQRSSSSAIVAGSPRSQGRMAIAVPLDWAIEDEKKEEGITLPLFKI